MDSGRTGADLRLLGLLFQAHPWHGVELGPEAPRW